ncbi:MAG: PLD-like domain protein, partial [Devosia sp.]|uniref:hypothetical protein n=1 Tax=Devosia sp. TaxID=1871048 RepID=UPI0026318472
EAASALLSALAKRGSRTVYFDVRAESQPDGRTRVFASKAMVEFVANRTQVAVRPVRAEQIGEMRDLHAKMIYLANEEWILLLMGSSNFTRAGLGAGERNGNFEANLAYRVRCSDADAKMLNAIWPEVDDCLDIDSDQLIWEPQDEKAQDGYGDVPLPAAFEEASFVPGPPPRLSITLRDPLPASWVILAADGRKLLSSQGGGRSGEHLTEWTGPAVPVVLEVTWTHASGQATANWPVNVSNPAALPPPEALLSLTLEELLDILASTRPIPQAVAEALARRNAKKEKADSALDPLKRFDSQSFLLRRTKRLAAALERLRERLELPASSREAFDWRLSGPIGPLALAGCYIREANFPGEAKFCLAEIALALHRVRPDRVIAEGLPKAVVSECLNNAINELAQRAGEAEAHTDLDNYASAAFAEARQ